MPTYIIRGISVHFPFEAYDCQKVYMGKVIDTLNGGQNALLESPTGTGKTLCLLCATLAWRAHLPQARSGRTRTTGAETASATAGSQGIGIRTEGLDQDVDDDDSGIAGNSQTQGSSARKRSSRERGLPSILYASRTHSQLQQVVKELRATQYRPQMSVIGGREQSCIHPDVSQMRGTAQNLACRQLVKTRTCSHYLAAGGYLREHPDIGTEPVDIEDLMKIGRTHGPCPYYMSRELMESADIIFMPYNYLIYRDKRQALCTKKGGRLGVDWSNAILIFDEAHNVEEACAEAASIEFPAFMISGCIMEAKSCVELASQQRSATGSGDSHSDPETYAVLKGLLVALETKIAEVKIEEPDMGFTRPGAYIHEFLAELNITHNTLPMLLDAIEHAVELLADNKNNQGQTKGKFKQNQRPKANEKEKDKDEGVHTSFRLQSLHEGLSTIFRSTDASYALSFRTHIGVSKGGGRVAPSGRGGSKAGSSRTLSWWCFNPGLMMSEIKQLGVRSIILTSGTLSPLDSFAHELKIPFEIRQENPHVIQEQQIWVGVVPAGPSRRPLNSSYRTRDSPEYKMELGNAIVNFARIIPDGLLVFFPSYRVLESCIDAWQASGVWERIRRLKQPVIEPREGNIFNQAIEDYAEKLADPSSPGAVFFAVCRGKVSEGLDFADRAGRGVIITGIPYAMKMDAKVQLKKEYLDEQLRGASSRGHGGLSGDEWYVQQASRAVNQAVGRVIRHRSDYGAILLCDERFLTSQAHNQMSLWLRPHLRAYHKFGEAMGTLSKFFRDKNEFVVPLAKVAKQVSEWVSPSAPPVAPVDVQQRDDGGKPGKAVMADGTTRKGAPVALPPGFLSKLLAEQPEDAENSSPFSDSTSSARRPISAMLAEARQLATASRSQPAPSGHSAERDNSGGRVAARQVASAADAARRLNPDTVTAANQAVGSSQGSFGPPAGSAAPTEPFVAAPAHILEALRRKAANGSALAGRFASSGQPTATEGREGVETGGPSPSDPALNRCRTSGVGEGGSQGRADPRASSPSNGGRSATDEHHGGGLDGRHAAKADQGGRSFGNRPGDRLGDGASGSSSKRLRTDEAEGHTIGSGAASLPRHHGRPASPPLMGGESYAGTGEAAAEQGLAGGTDRREAGPQEGLNGGQLASGGSAGQRGPGEGAAPGGASKGGGQGRTGKGQQASAYIQDVKNQLSTVEFTLFLKAMKRYKLASYSVEALLGEVASLFRARERFPLLQRWVLSRFSLASSVILCVVQTDFLISVVRCTFLSCHTSTSPLDKFVGKVVLRKEVPPTHSSLVLGRSCRKCGSCGNHATMRLHEVIRNAI